MTMSSSETTPARVDPMKPSAVRIPPALLALVERDKAATGRTNGQVLLEAVRDCYERNVLPKLLGVTTVGGDLFGEWQTRPPTPTTERPVTLHIRLKTSHYEVLDRLVDEFQAGSRNRLATVALDDYLTNRYAEPAVPVDQHPARETP